jgi:hypothetical protein
MVMPSTTIKARSVTNNAIFLLRPTHDALKDGLAQYSEVLQDILGSTRGHRVRLPSHSIARVWHFGNRF